MRPGAIDRLYLAASTPHGEAEPGPEAVEVLIASHDPATIAHAAPRVAAQLHPGRTFGRVLWSEPVPGIPEPKDWRSRPSAPANPWPPDWSAVAVEVRRDRATVR